MSNYTKATNFATKDTLPTGDSNKIVKGTEIDNEFNAISGAVSSKSDLASPAFTGVPTAPTATAGSNTTQIANTAFVTAALQAVYPIGSIYVNATSSSNPSTLLGFGTWTAFGIGRVMVGLDPGDADFDTAEEMGGSKNAVVVSHTHTATVTDPGHAHKWGSAPQTTRMAGTQGQYDGNGSTQNNTSNVTTGITVSNSTTGVSGTNANLQPFVVVRMWKRTA